MVFEKYQVAQKYQMRFILKLLIIYFIIYSSLVIAFVGVLIHVRNLLHLLARPENE